MNYGILLENNNELSDFLLFIYENEIVLADINIPYEWKTLIDESYDEYDNKYYSLTNRAIEVLIAEGLMANIGNKALVGMAKGANALKGAKNMANLGVVKGVNTVNKGMNAFDKGIDKTIGKKSTKVANAIKGMKGAAVHLGAEMATHNPQVASGLLNAGSAAGAHLH